MQVETIRHKNVYGKENLYIKISDGVNEVLINVGEKTFNGVEKLLNPKQKVNEAKQSGK